MVGDVILVMLFELDGQDVEEICFNCCKKYFGLGVCGLVV